VASDCVSRWPGNPAHVPLLLFNGIGARLELLAPFVDALGGAAETITFDIPGAGESPPPLLPYRLWMLARLTSRLLDVLGYERVDVMGISWGGTIAQQFALQCSARCRRLILAATTQGKPASLVQVGGAAPTQRSRLSKRELRYDVRRRRAREPRAVRTGGSRW